MRVRRWSRTVEPQSPPALAPRDIALPPVWFRHNLTSFRHTADAADGLYRPVDARPTRNGPAGVSSNLHPTGQMTNRYPTLATATATGRAHTSAQPAATPSACPTLT